MTSPPRQRPAHTADERTQLIGWLDMQRAVIAWKCEGLSDADAHRSLLPTSPLMTVAGLVSHLRWVENLWFEYMFLGRPAEGPRFAEGPEDADMRVDGVPLAQLLADYQQQCALSNEIIAAHGLDALGQQTRYASGSASLRWMLFHMIEETARHAGHLDTIRELLDGETGYY
ncbi:DinB family protein [Streptomyces zagrosensis]|uniref:Putative damage-inducible protein DinB n=1 Tax=Streptomyces zagrosensis TaxID=1042984 RepID=A0A7W9UWF2_9ACTN|nr:DinB family protein [Streptomyces zagrosensis]MBB5933256.1 putative damage-inducible protein DinB [Streptomyces zagrosensis]